MEDEPGKVKVHADHPAPKSLTATIKEQPNSIVDDDAVGEGAKRNPIHAHYAAKFDGKDYPLSGAADADTVNIKRIDENTIESTRKKNGQVITTIRSVVSADGKTRTSTWSGKDSKGSPKTWTVVLDDSEQVYAPSVGPRDRSTHDSIDIRKRLRSPIARVSKVLKPFFLYMSTLRGFAVSRNTGIAFSFILWIIGFINALANPFPCASGATPIKYKWQ
jgi:hypothetical protein